MQCALWNSLVVSSFCLRVRVCVCVFVCMLVDGLPESKKGSALFSVCLFCFFSLFQPLLLLCWARRRKVGRPALFPPPPADTKVHKKEKRRRTRMMKSNEMNAASATPEQVSLSRIPLDVLRLVLSFLPAPVTLNTVAVVSSLFSAVTRSGTYWQNVWVERVSACFRSYAQVANLLSSSNGFSHASSSHALLEDHKILLASVPSLALPRLCVHGGGGGLSITEENDDKKSRITQMRLRVGSMVLLSAPPIDASTLAQHLISSSSREEQCDHHRHDGDEGKNELGAADELRRKNDVNVHLRLRKALYFLDDEKALDLATKRRPMIDSLHAIRLFMLHLALPPPHRREGTLLEREAVLAEFISALVYAWEYCHPSMDGPDMSTMRRLLPQMELMSTILFVGDGEEEEEAVETGDGYTDVFFPVADKLSSLPFPAPFQSSPLSVSSNGVLIAGYEAGTACRLRYSLADTLVYLFLLHHVTFSDIHQHVWDDERKCAICSRLLSPTGHAVEFRFFMSSLRGSYPRFFVKMAFSEGELPHTCIREKFDHESSRNAISLLGSSSSDGVVPKILTLFYGGFGRVEVDIPPTVSRDGFLRLRELLGLAPTFPMQLLWNVVVLATGVGGALLRAQGPYFKLYYETSFTAAFENTFPAKTAGCEPTQVVRDGV
ncbi:hypothetical protein MOQ_005845 [Trypanosoma cruzi marinkellei]|uniref:F-box domain-containing protein n=1 Tax=Trypanosoma cruzi marinkellei TaxID=85056 RepID=K2NNA7_TRYCR|nr:hypothetical protein MOQ_005845 [Trypanosoma cruzi marinkellei]